jgi:HSP20 family protein
MELPGVKKEDVKLDLTQRSLSVSAERKLSTDTGERTQSYTRSLTLPADVATENISAKLEDGILTLTLPKAAEARSRSISIA